MDTKTQGRQGNIGNITELHGCFTRCYPVPGPSQIAHSFLGQTTPGPSMISEILFIPGEIHGN